jgi:hypothetical protein
MSKKKVAVFGLGKIGVEYDLDSNYNWIPNQVKSHVKAVKDSMDFELTYIADIDISKLNRVKAIIGDTKCGSLEDILKLQAPDIAIISVPTTEHLKVFNLIGSAWPEVNYLIEKPMGNSHSEAMKILESAVASKQKIFVNYFRRYLNNFQSLVQSYSFAKRGNLLDVYICASGTMKNTFSHFIDLIIFLEGQYIINIENSFSVINKNCQKIIFDRNKNCRFVFENIRTGNSDFYMSMNYVNCRIVITKNGRVIDLMNTHGVSIERFEISLEEFNHYQKTVLNRVYKSLKLPVDYEQIKNSICIQKFIELVDLIDEK